MFKFAHTYTYIDFIRFEMKSWTRASIQSSRMYFYFTLQNELVAY